MAKLEIHQIPALSDNYVYLIHEAEAGLTAVIDPAEHEPVQAALADKGWKLTHIINTHHHGDHTGGNLALKEATGCTVVGAGIDAHRIPGIDIEVGEGDTYSFGGADSLVYETPGHTVGHIAFWFEESDALFCGDTMFAMGCGRILEGTAEQLWDSLSRLMKLPKETWIYCGHEYTKANGEFALSVEPGNQALVDRVEEVKKLREQDRYTVPSQLGDELATNPFLRVNSEEIREVIGFEDKDDLSVFTEVRLRKDNF
ncbi:MAG: hydroxyacylglutathione hydrolase [Rhodospirillaceae bacterium]|nr:hydroxyacylglutathione hydrolase [Rhodospirillaceae bacterium]